MTNPAISHDAHPATGAHQAGTKPSKVEHLKDKAAALVDKVKGKPHAHPDGTVSHNENTTHHEKQHPNTFDPLHKEHQPNPLHKDHQPNPLHKDHQSNPLHKDHQPNHKDHSNPIHTGAAMAGTAIPHNNSVNRAAYQPAVAGTHHDNTHPTGTHNSAPTGLTGEHSGYPHPQNPALVNPAATHPSAPHTATNPVLGHSSATHDQNLNHSGAPAGPTGTSHVPTFAQNIAPTAAGVVPTAHVAEPVHGHHDKHGAHHGHHDQQHHLGQHQQHQQHGLPGQHTNTVPVNASVPAPSQHNPQLPIGATGVQQVHLMNEQNQHHQQHQQPASNVIGSTTTTTTATGSHLPGAFPHQQQHGHQGLQNPIAPPVPSKEGAPHPVI